MKRFHVNLSVADLSASVGFYTELFGVPPAVEKSDYAKWMLDDPHINFALTTRGEQRGIDHVGLQAQDEAEFADIRAKLARAEGPVFDQGDVTCCYAESTKAWIRDPDGVAWETFLSHGESTVYGDGTRANASRSSDTESAEEAGCCGRPTTKEIADSSDSCCGPS